MHRRSAEDRGRWGHWLILFAIATALCFAAAELMARAYWRIGFGVPFLHPEHILYAFYPELRMVDDARPSRFDKHYDILLLGASTLHPEWGHVEQDLIEQLAYEGRRDVRVFNLAKPAQTSRDSLLKYRALDPALFDLVIFYDGINEVRANNVPPRLFRDDYGHYAWYEAVNALAGYHRKASLALPYTLRYLAVAMRQLLRPDDYVATDIPRREWLDHGKVPRSAEPFERNIGDILDLASARGDKVMLMTFAVYAPQNYSFEAFKEKRLDYGLHLVPLELWGRREHVLATVARHNEVIRKLAAKHPEVLFVDQATLMAGHPRYFNDPCHLTASGALAFVNNIVAVLVPEHGPD
jgi:hypothetical protein